MKLQIKAAVQTHVGKVRANNEDNYYLKGHIRRDVSAKEKKFQWRGMDHKFLSAVADGMGGEECGECASLIAVKSLHECSFTDIPDIAMSDIRQANREICIEIEKSGGRRMGSTLAALYIDAGKAQCCNVGDSRIYFLRAGKLSQFTVDHNRARHMVELGVLTPEQAENHPSRHELIQHLGIFEEEMIIEPYFSETISLQAGDCFLLCSDGLNDMVKEDEIAARLIQGGKPEDVAAGLVDLALEHGGRDNVTVLVVQIQNSSSLFGWHRR